MRNSCARKRDLERPRQRIIRVSSRKADTGFRQTRLKGRRRQTKRKPRDAIQCRTLLRLVADHVVLPKLAALMTVASLRRVSRRRNERPRACGLRQCRYASRSCEAVLWIFELRLGQLPAPRSTHRAMAVRTYAANEFASAARRATSWRRDPKLLPVLRRRSFRASAQRRPPLCVEPGPEAQMRARFDGRLS